MTVMEAPAPSRRAFLAGAGGLVIAVALPVKSRGQSGEERIFGGGDASNIKYAPNAFVRISPDNTVTILIKHIEFGQGPFTGLATLVADEMDADWSQIRAEHAPANAELYGNIMFGGMQGTGGSTAMAASFDVMRKAGAAAKAMLVAAAAESWGVPASEISVSKGVLSHSSGKSGSFGEFAEAAAAQEAPAEPTLKTPDQWIYIGKDVPKLDTGMKSTGEAQFTLDIYREGMLTVVVAHPVKFGATVASFDDKAAREVPGVVDVKKISSGVAIYAKNTFAALKARKALKVEWDESAAETRSTDEIAAERRDAVKSRGAVAGENGTVDDSAFADAANSIEAEYIFPYLVHAPMEPLDAVVERKEDGGVEVWMGSQIQTMDKATIAEACNVEPEKVTLNTVLAGGSFGRRAQSDAHFAREAAEVFMAAGGETPVKLMWTREDDIQGGYYRPLMVHRMRGAVNDAGDIAAWEHVIAGQSFVANSPFEGMLQGGVDATMVEGASETPYALPNYNTSAHIINNPVTTLWWRSVGHTHTGYAVETFIDELLEKAGKDPVEGRLALMTAPKHQRLANVLKRVNAMAGGMEAPEGRARGVAAVESFRSYVAEIAEVSMEDGLPRVHKVWCAVDCGIPVNPEIIKAQMEGGIGYGLSAILFNELTLDEGGAVTQSNFHDYRSLRISEMPDVEVEIIASNEPPTGVGEPGLPPIGPAVANAVRRLSGATPRNLPMIKSLQA
ncbi:xanthine dehydrogenase family protein molybdopterin-binding subunit [Hyphococcus luteus]|uniref:Twin-arginine translocation pathway signal protein n=1 Tax=Hyphococcus luteus TaxID=2058213 RepID=A0A2S7K0M7_9PROT|nr:xanthine dehydrogenase family protein molybdopterin-binding subunit [Marinicaulis flavus]PQA86054.1 twin-arginine translocation pathway signal protein [Marinicaulis flavus]